MHFSLRSIWSLSIRYCAWPLWPSRVKLTSSGVGRKAYYPLYSSDKTQTAFVDNGVLEFLGSLIVLSPMLMEIIAC